MVDTLPCRVVTIARVVRCIDADTCEFVYGCRHGEKTPEGIAGTLTPMAISPTFGGGITSS
jgi:hypothetical protein